MLLLSVCPDARSRLGHSDIVSSSPDRNVPTTHDTNQLVVEGASGSGLTAAGLLAGTAARDEDEAKPEELVEATTGSGRLGRVLFDLGGRPRRLGTVPRATMQSAVGVEDWALGSSHRRSPC